MDDYTFTHWHVNWDEGKGTIEGGSSGSPLFDKNHRIIGQLHGYLTASVPTGEDLCYDDLISTYGRINESWQNSLMLHHLDPLATGQSHIDTYCSTNDPDEPDDPNDPGWLCYHVWQDICINKFSEYGFLINGQNKEIVEICLDNDDIIVSATTSQTCLEICGTDKGRLPLTKVIKRMKCKNAQSDPATHPIVCEHVPWTFETKCDCRFMQIFVSVTEVDAELSPIGIEYGEWKSINYDELLFANIPTVRLQSFSLLDYLPLGIIILPNKYYKLKLANNHFGSWDEGTKYFHTFSNEININGVNPSHNLYGENITLENTTITKYITATASNFIKILPETILKSGRYSIDTTISYSSFILSSLSNIQNSTVNKKQSINMGHESSESIFFEKNTQEMNNPLTIYPNPTNGYLSINIGNDVDDGEITIMNMLGTIIEKQKINASITHLDLSKYPKGFYYLIIKTATQIISNKIIKQ